MRRGRKREYLQSYLDEQDVAPVERAGTQQTVQTSVYAIFLLQYVVLNRVL